MMCSQSRCQACAIIGTAGPLLVEALELLQRLVAAAVWMGRRSLASARGGRGS
jgi:hypothetical protein